MIASSKELADALEGSEKRDMTKAQMVRSLFRLISSDLTALGVPLFVTNHIVTDIGNPYAQFTQSGGMGITYATSAIISLSKARLKDDKADAAKQTGIIVTVRAEKNRFAKPEKAKIKINYTSGMNAYVGLEDFVSWDVCGLQKGNILTEKDFSKLTDAAKAECRQFADMDGVVVYFSPKETARNYICKHLGRAVSNTEVYSAEVFTLDVIKNIDEKVIIPTFAFGENSTELSLIDQDFEEMSGDLE
jgi:hypothetical protein